MPGTSRAPFFSHPAVFQDQPPIAARISTATPQALINGFNLLTFATPVNEDPLNLKAWQSIWTPTTPSRFTITVRGFYMFGGCCEVGGLASPRYIMELRRSGVPMCRGENNAVAAWTSVSASTLIPCVQGDYLEVYMYLDAGGPVNTTPFGSIPNMWTIRVG